MSTFNGIIKEFPNIRIDYFRVHPDLPRPNALFLSHVHSDHLMGLESVKMPFVYCSSTTKRLLLKLEKYPHRINFAKGILEARRQHYKALKTILRALPLQTPIELELNPKSRIRVTLFDANHCPGAVMFLIEGDGKAVLYTGDIRSEQWWVNALIQNPVLLPYTTDLKILDCLYLDTTFASHEEPYREFQSQRQGLAELMRKVNECSADTIFYFRAWTLGYEAVWLTLSNLLRSKVHVDSYQYHLFKSIAEVVGDGAFQVPSLAGYTVGNNFVEGCLTLDQSARIHSCEPGSQCYSAIKNDPKVIWITPIVSRLEDGTEVRELGAGGGGGDLYQTPELQLGDLESLQTFARMCLDLIKDGETSARIQQELMRADRSLRYRIALEGMSLADDQELEIKAFIDMLSDRDNELFRATPHLGNDPAQRSQRTMEAEEAAVPSRFDHRTKQPNTIRFPYSRHSSYTELRQLVSMLRPKDICPCTVDLENWTLDMSMEYLFGDLCSERVFHSDEEIRVLATDLQKQKSGPHSLGKGGIAADSQRTDSEDEDQGVRGSAQGNDMSVKSAHQAQPPQAIRSIPTHNVAGSVDDRSTRYGSFTQSRECAIAIECLPIQQEFLSINNGNDIIYADTQDGFEIRCFEHSLPLSAFDGNNDDTVKDDLSEAKECESPTHGPGESCTEKYHGASFINHVKRRTRIEAFAAASQCLSGNDPSAWNDLVLRSIGHKGHTKQELYL